MKFEYTRYDLEEGVLGKEMREKVKKCCPSFKKTDMSEMINWLIEHEYIKIKKIKKGSSGRPKEVIKTIEKSDIEKVPF